MIKKLTKPQFFCLVLIICGTVLGLAGVDGWGWLIFLAFLLVS